MPPTLPSPWRIALIALAAFITSVHAQGTNLKDLSGLVGETILLPCSVNSGKCGELHSIKWYRGSSRIFVFSDKAKISRSEGEYVDRAELQYAGNSTTSHLSLKKLEVGDEAVYKCEITYLEVREGCQVVQFINLTTLIKPEYVRITRGEGQEVSNGTLIGPLSEDDDLNLLCESGGGKPIPTVQWWNGTTLMNGEYTSEPSSNGIGTGRNRVKVKVGRGDLGAKYECRATNIALSTPMTSMLEIEVNVRPLRLELTGVEDHVIQGTRVVLECKVSGARPPANVTWFNGTTKVESTSDSKPKADGTYDTVSKLVFTATRYENEQSLSCEATNEIMKSRKELAMRDTVSLEVLYPPIVTVNNENVTVNESTDVLLFCTYEANPSSLKSVKWLRDDEEVDVSNIDHFEGGTVEQPTILIKNATRNDHGIYTCVLENQVGSSESYNSVFVSIHYKPTVNLTMIPTTPVSELDEENITLICLVSSGNPETLLAVRWFLDGQLLKELPDCNYPNSTFCDVDPSKLLLEVVGRSFHGNYSCIGMNEAGWGELSKETELIVYYPPGPATLLHSPSRVVKRGSLSLSCSVDDPGRPDNLTFRWTRNNYPVLDVTSGNWTIDPVTLETDANFTCRAVNLGGDSRPASQYIQVLAPPTFIERLPPYYGALMSAESISVTCRVECSPICIIDWFKNGMKLDTGSNMKYWTHNMVIPPDPRTNDFQSVQSTLNWNMSAWPGGQLDRISDNANYTCQSTGNSIGPGVKSTTFFGVEYPPENLTVSNKVVNVIEGNVPEKVLCSAKAYPEATYQWRRDGENDIIMKGNAMILNFPVLRRHGGHYLCEAYNRHGKNFEKTFINVLYKPECGITQTEVDGKLVLICTAHANPTEVDFVWKIKNDNETIEENVEKRGLQSILTLETRFENFRTYICFANNSVGTSIPCERDVTGAVSWWRRLENDNWVIIVAVICAVVIMVLLICIVIIMVCRKRRESDKYNNPVELEERENPEGNPGSPPSMVAPRWPLRPGVLVHVNTNHSLSSSRIPGLLSNSSTPLPSSGSQSSDQKRQQRRAISLANLNESQHSRANRIRQMFSPDQRNKYRCDTLPGVIHSKNGVVTFKKVDAAVSQDPMKIWKKTGSGPNPSTTKDKSDLNSSPNDALLQPDSDRAFYENLPFHGMQNPPNKSVCVTGTTNGENRPPSELSQYGGSSGYGSTRSHTSPQINFSGGDTPKNRNPRKFLTVRAGKRVRNWPQFRSLRVQKNSAMDTLKETSPEHKKENNNNEDTIDEPPPALPVPAPRKFSPNARPPITKHTYQNVPVPITPNTAQKTEISSDNQNEIENQQCQLTNHQSTLDRQKLLLNSSSTNGRHSLKKKKSQQQMQHCIRGRDDVISYQPPGSYHRSNIQLPSPPPPPPTYLMNNGGGGGGGGLLYSDLPQQQHRSRTSLPHIPLYAPPNARNQAEYAMIKFHDVGQEIDV